MRKWLPVVVFLVVFALCQIFLPYTFYALEDQTLFLFTPDYFSQVCSMPCGFACLMYSFVVQFFVIPCVGASVVALLALSVYWAIGRLARPLFSALAVCAVVAVLVSLPTVRQTERWHRLEHAAMQYDWDEVLRIATPERCKEEAEMTPYALLALGERGELPTKMFSYPVASAESLTFEGWQSREAYLFQTLLYACTGCYAEAAHRNIQLGTYLSHGTSFGVLRRSVWLYDNLHDNALADKYRSILRCSVLHHNWKHAPAPVRKDQTVAADNHSDTIPAITDQFLYNMAALVNEGYVSRPNIDRMLCAALAQRDLASFMKFMEGVAGRQEQLATHYQEAILVAAMLQPSQNVDKYHISASVRSAFQRFSTLMNQQQVYAAKAAFPHTFWSFYFDESGVFSSTKGK
ncbi:MAG: DUF6057 family protein [Bacteroidales bacterium]|nr:DUF6057 family protein [Bacteroidales bacterium]